MHARTKDVADCFQKGFLPILTQALVESHALNAWSAGSAEQNLFLFECSVLVFPCHHEMWQSSSHIDIQSWHFYLVASCHTCFASIHLKWMKSNPACSDHMPGKPSMILVSTWMMRWGFFIPLLILSVALIDKASYLSVKKPPQLWEVGTKYFLQAPKCGRQSYFALKWCTTIHYVCDMFSTAWLGLTTWWLSFSKACVGTRQSSQVCYHLWPVAMVQGLKDNCVLVPYKFHASGIG